MRAAPAALAAAALLLAAAPAAAQADTAALFARADSLIQEGHADSALPILDALIRDDPRAEYFARRAHAHRGSGGDDSAMADLNEAIRRDPANRTYRFDRAQGLWGSGDSPAALVELDEMIRTDPSDSETVMWRCYLYFEQALLDPRFASSNGDSIFSDVRRWIDISGVPGPLELSYGAVMGYLGGRWAGRETEAQAFFDEIAPRCDEAVWPYPVVRYLRGEIPYRALARIARREKKGDFLNLGRYEELLREVRKVPERFVAAAEETETPVLVPQMGHPGWVWKVAFAPDGRTIASIGGDDLVRVWDAATGRLARTYATEPGRIAFSPDGRRFVAADEDGGVALYDAGTGRVERVLREGEGSYVNDVAFSPGGETCLAAGAGVSIWSVATGRLVTAIPEEKMPFSDNVEIGPDGRYLFTRGGFGADSFVRVLDAATGEPVRSFGTSENQLRRIVVGADGRILYATGYGDTTIRAWEIETGRLAMTFEGHAETVVAVALSPDGRTLASGSDDETLRLWDAGTGRLLRTFEENAGVVYDLSFSPDGRTLASGSGDKIVRLWDVESGRLVRAFEGAAPVHQAAFSRDGRTIATGSGDFTVRLWDAATGRLARTLEGHGAGVKSVAFSADDRTVVSASWDETVRLWNARTGEPIRALTGLIRAAVGPDTGVVATGDEAGTIRLWDAGTGRAIRKFPPTSGRITSLAFAPDGRRLASGHSDTFIRIWEVSTGREVRTIEKRSGILHDPPTYALAFSPDGRFLAENGGYGGFITPAGARVWDLEADSPHSGFSRSFGGHTNGASAVAYSPDGRYLATGGQDNAVILFDTFAQIVRTFEGHSAPVKSVAFSPDGRFLLTASDDATARLWNAGTGEEIVRLMTFPGGEWVAMTPDNYYASSPRGAEHLYFRVGDALYDVSQYERIYRRPEIVEERLARAARGETALVPPASGATEAVAAVPTARPPRLVILDPYQDRDVAEGRLRVVVRAEDEALAVTSVHLVVNGRPAAEGAFTVPAGARAGVPAIATGEVALAGGENVIEAWSENAAGLLSRKERVTVTYRPAAAAAGAPAARPRAFVLSIGVSDYARDEMDLRYARADAEAVVDALRAQAGEGRLFETAQIVFLADTAATSQAVRVALHEFLGRAATEDLVFIFLAGHTVPDRGDHYFLPYDGDMDRPYLAGIPYKELERTFEGLGAQRCVLLIDSCHSGAFGTRGSADGAYQRAVQAFAEGAGMYVISAATGREFALERNDWGHGAFTKALVDGLGGEADGLIGPADGFVTVEEVKLFVSRRVPELTNGRQHPTYPLVRQGQDFPVSLIGR